MLNSLKKIFSQTKSDSEESDSKEELKLLCGLMLEAAQIDGNVDKIEIEKISKSLIDVFQEDPSFVDQGLQIALKEVNEPKSLHFFTSKLNKILSNEKKLILIETLWGIVLSDGAVHEFESNLIRRLAGLLYISDISCGNARKKALSKL